VELYRIHVCVEGIMYSHPHAMYIHTVTRETARSIELATVEKKKNLLLVIPAIGVCISHCCHRVLLLTEVKCVQLSIVSTNVMNSNMFAKI